MDKIKAFYKIGPRKAIPLMVTEQKAQVIKELNRDFDRQYKADITYHKRTISMDSLMADDLDFDLYKLNNSKDTLENQIIERLDNGMLISKLYEIMDKNLNQRQKKLVKMIYFEGQTQTSVAKYFGVSRSAISEAMARIYAKLKKFLLKTIKLPLDTFQDI